MDVSLLAKGDHLRVVLKGRLDEAGAEALRKRLAGVNLGSYKDLAFDCAGLEYISSAGIGTLLRYHAFLAKGGGRLRLERVSPQIRNLFHTLKLDQVMNIA